MKNIENPSVDIDAVSARFVEARKTHKGLTQYPGTIPDSLDIAYQIQAKSIQAWQTLPALANIPTPRVGANVVVKGHEIWVIGGESGKHIQAHVEVEVLNTLTNTWRIAPNLNVGRHSGGAALYNEEIIVVSGSGKRGGRPELTSIEVLTDF